jgi:hypothetical protein
MFTHITVLHKKPANDLALRNNGKKRKEKKQWQETFLPQTKEVESSRTGNQHDCSFSFPTDSTL